MITHIRVQNFKSWEDSRIVPLAPLTGFFGANSSGKSSLLQMLLLLKQTAEHTDNNEVIFFGDDSSYVNLGNFHEVIHGHNNEELLKMGFYCILSEPVTIKIPQYGLENSYLQYGNFNFQTVIQNYQGTHVPKHISYNLGGSGIDIIKLENAEITYRSKRLFTGTFKNCYSIEETTNAYPGSNEFLYFLSSQFEDIFSHVFYLGPIRTHPKRNFHWEGSHPKGIGKFGDKTIDALLSARIDKKTIMDNEKEKSIEEKISDWLREMDLAYTFLLERSESKDGKDYEVRFQKRENGTKIALADMGYGLSQFLPVLVLCYYVPEGSTLILEQPGIHLHPKVQSQLADLLIEVVNERKLQILVESHSEHLLTRIQRRIVEKQIESNDVALYFCRNDGDASTIDKLDVDEESGDIKNWPENFFGDVMGDMFAMTDKQVERIAENEPEE